MNPTILFEDEFILVVDKPAGMTVNRSQTTSKEQTVQDWAEKYLKISKEEKVSEVSNGEVTSDTIGAFPTSDTFYDRGGIVHRLDKETSGVLLLAKTEGAFYASQKQFKDRLVHKTYTALVHGRVVPSSGKIQVPVGRLPWNRKQFGVIAGGREAMTEYKTISNFIRQTGGSNGERELTLLKLHPETGRTHQIRVHLKYIGYPIFSDFLYAGRKIAKSDRALLPRVFLHASSLTMHHPQTSEKLTFESTLPQELSAFLASIRRIEET